MTQEAHQKEVIVAENGNILIRAAINGVQITVAKRDLDNEDFTDPNFFDDDWSPAAATGFVVWQGTFLFVKMLQEELASKLVGKRVLELGSGIGLAGLCAAAMGAHVLQTDLPSVVYGALIPNIIQNTANAPPQPLADSTNRGESGDATAGDNRSLSPDKWRGARALGGGLVAAMALDWREPIGQQQSVASEDFGGANDPLEAEVILAVETVWLIDLIRPFVDTAVAVMRGSRRPRCYFINGERAQADSKSFAKMADVIAAFEASGCSTRQIHEAPSDEPGKPTKVFEIALLR
eukprot:CAMPEP_0118923200 /NCGR_PEP_ID=MMETSP1169-20130426/1816_1 /TAXON_ID=36882 /ORGANISM="Pyramimonas obovata, Strain CCMP722" /LENGTH=292 /DNA_ID=CAMNT_0006864153 /DNA_START=241 /DNA_END=1118 /DNA_ORIENTATION=+